MRGTAQFQTTCRACRGQIKLGQPMVYDEKGARHPGCKVTTELKRRRRKKRRR